MSTIGSEFARSVINFPKGNKSIIKPPFWDKYGGDTYSLLNDIAVPISDQAIQAFQLQKLEEIANVEIAKQISSHGAVAKELSNMIVSGKMNNALQGYEQEEKNALNQVITNWMNMLNEGYAYQGKESFSQQEYNTIQNYLLRISNELDRIISMLQANNNKILGSYLIELKTLMDAANFTPDNVTSWIHHMSQLKGDTVEQIGKEWLTKKGAPNIQSIVTGALEYRGQKYEHQGQLIQDLMLIKIDQPELLKTVEISYTVAGSNVLKKMCLGDFIKMLDGLSKDSKHIMLTDNGYENLMKYSALNIQAKAGINQLPWNKNASTSVSIMDFTDETGPAMTISARHAFLLLKSLNNLDPKETYWTLKDTSYTYNAMANYGLATALAKVLHLEADFGNQYLLTPSGFISFPERMRQLFKDEKYRAYMQGQINLSAPLDTPHTVNITGHR